jgi:hypothetical protein
MMPAVEVWKVNPDTLPDLAKYPIRLTMPLAWQLFLFITQGSENVDGVLLFNIISYHFLPDATNRRYETFLLWCGIHPGIWDVNKRQCALVSQTWATNPRGMRTHC